MPDSKVRGSSPGRGDLPNIKWAVRHQLASESRDLIFNESFRRQYPMCHLSIYPCIAIIRGVEGKFRIWDFCHLKSGFGILEPFEIWIWDFVVFEIWIWDLKIWILDLIYGNLDFGFGPVWKLDFGFQAVWNPDSGFPDPPLHTPIICYNHFRNTITTS